MKSKIAAYVPDWSHGRPEIEVPLQGRKSSAPKRPKSLTFVAVLFMLWGIFLIGFALWNAVSQGDRYLNNPNVVLQDLFALIGPITCLICGVGIMVGFNWARWLFVVVYGANLVLTGLLVRTEGSAGGKLFILFVWLGFVYLLFRPQASVFFSSKRMARLSAKLPPSDISSESTGENADSFK